METWMNFINGYILPSLSVLLWSVISLNALSVTLIRRKRRLLNTAKRLLSFSTATGVKGSQITSPNPSGRDLDIAAEDPYYEPLFEERRDL